MWVPCFVAQEKSAMENQKKLTRKSIAISIGMLLIGLLVGFRLTDELVGCLGELKVPFTGVLNYTFLIAAALAWVIWFVACRKYWNASLIGSVLLWGLIVFGVNQYAKERVHAIYISRNLTDLEQKTLAELPFPAMQHVFSEGFGVIVENDPERIFKVSEILYTFRLVKPPATRPAVRVEATTAPSDND
jgi:hypothetical protein